MAGMEESKPAVPATLVVGGDSTSTFRVVSERFPLWKREGETAC